MYSEPKASVCLEAYVTLRVFSPGHSCDDISQRLGLKPTKCGAVTSNRSKGWTCWRLDSDGIASSREPEEHVNWLLDRIEPVAAELGKLVSENAKADIVGFHVSTDLVAPQLDRPQRERLARLGLELEWWLYDGKPDDYAS